MTKTQDRELVAPNYCTNCGSAVESRRPSQTGLHFCARQECKAAKQREYLKLRVKKIKTDDDEVKVRFLTAALFTPRVQCLTCGLVDALPGFAHRAPDNNGCQAVGPHYPALKAAWVDAVWPSPRVYADVEGS